MKNFSYTKSPLLNQEIVKLEDLRTKLLLKPISPRKELQLQWITYIEHIHYFLALMGEMVSRDQIQAYLSPQGVRRLDDTGKKIIHYRNALDYLYHEWLVNENLVTAKTIITLYEKAFDGKLKIDEKELDNALQYAQINPEYPVIQAALAQYFILDLDPFTSDNEGLSYLVFLLFLYKTGYDFRRMLALEKFYFEDLARYKNLLTKLSRGENVTEWLEYVAKGIVKYIQNTTLEIDHIDERSNDDKNTFALNERQKSILSLLSEPQSKISNKNVQKIFKVSQITASRDLAKLTSLGLLLTIGKGRSTYYTKV